MRRLAASAVAAAFVALSAGAETGAEEDTSARGQDAAEAFLSGEADVLWQDMGPDMREALGAPGALTTLRDDVAGDFGTETEILSERVVTRGGYEVYQRVSRWTEGDAPLVITVALAGDGRIAGFTVQPQQEPAESAHLDYETRAELRLPFEGAWQVYWGGRTVEDNYHAIDPGQRFALDLVVMDDGQSHSGDAAVLENYHCWDRPVLAPADGVAAVVIDDQPDQPIGETDAENPAGNHVGIDFGQGEFGFLAHLRRGSVTVREGDHVAAGDEVGRCGNSGNTSEPHVHFHMQTTPDLGRGEGLPAQFAAYLADGERVEDGEPVRGQTIEPEG